MIIKRKGDYEWDREWHQNHSALIVPKVSELALIYGKSIRETVHSWPDIFDFFIRVKVPRSSRLIGVQDGQEYPLQNTTRYYVTTEGMSLVKIMPPLAKKPDVWRHFAVEKGWQVCVCNNIADATAPINYDYYVNEIEKLTLAMK